jgi:hypothetical protein
LQIPIDGELSLAESLSDGRTLSFHELSTGNVVCDMMSMGNAFG